MENAVSLLVSDNQVLLGQLQLSLTKLSAASYCEAVSQLKSGSIGGHVRHILEHYISVLEQLPEVNYDQRARDQKVEQHLGAGLELINHIQQKLTQLPEDNLAIMVSSSTNPVQTSLSVESSLARELVFLHSHTTHHMAIIRLLALQLGCDVTDDFGKAPSTLKYENHVQS